MFYCAWSEFFSGMNIYVRPCSIMSRSNVTGGIDLELAPEVVTALDDVCILSPRSFDAPSLAALLKEVCLWLVEQRIGPRAHHDSYKSCDPYAQVDIASFPCAVPCLVFGVC